jgi:hypothetical protein
VIARVARLARRRGLLGGSRAWTAVWALLLAVRLARRLLKPKPKVLWSAALGEGDAYLVTGLPGGGGTAPG